MAKARAREQAPSPKWCVETAIHIAAPTETEARQYLFSVLDAGHRAMGQKLDEGGVVVLATHRIDPRTDLPPDQRQLNDEDLAANDQARAAKADRVARSALDSDEPRKEGGTA